MSVFHDDGQATLYLGDVREVLRGLPAGSVDCVVTDPPYGIGFMGKEWDNFRPSMVAALEESRDRKGSTRTLKFERYPSKMGRKAQGAGVAVEYDESRSGHLRFQEWSQEWAAEALRVAKPGAHLVVFGAPRSYHRMACGIEDAGWEIRDSLMWLFGSGFPKSENLDGAWKGWGTALKPGYEPIVLARKPFDVRTLRANVERHGCGGLHVEACRIGSAEPVTRIEHAPTGSARGYDGGLNGGRRAEPRSGRWPANLILDADAADVLDADVGMLTSGFMAAGTKREGMGWHGGRGGEVRHDTIGDSGPSRFFYTGKARRAERERFLDDLPPVRRSDGRRTDIENPRLRTSARRNHHPTVKPVDVMRWVVRLVTPPGGLILDPFIGSGTTAVAAKAEGFRCVGIDRERDYLEIARRRCAQQGLMPVGAS